LADRAIWAVSDHDAAKHHKMLRDSFPFLNLPENASYFNSGVLLMNLPACRKERIAERALAFLEEHGENCELRDQDALNATMKNNWGALPEYWNMQVIGGSVSSETLRRSPGTPGIIHYLGGDKPWPLRRQPAMREAFYAAFLASGWLPPALAQGWVLQRVAYARVRSIWVRGPRRMLARLGLAGAGARG
jgi:lipopolysaccharide biosynthesis glycosyltransferase